MSHFSGDVQTKICEVEDLACYSAAVKKHRQMRHANDTYIADYRRNCNCLPPCADVQYSTEITDLKYVRQKVIQT